MLVMDIKYNITRSKRKTVGITVLPDGSVLIKAPYRFPLEEIERIVYKHREWINKRIEGVLCDKRQALTREDELILRRIAERVIPERLWSLGERTGLVPSRVRISSAKKRFGSCSSRGSISISFYVMMLPEKAQELVLMHELCHLRHMDHSTAFYRLLSSFLPDHKDRKKLLSQEHLISMDEIKTVYAAYLSE